MNKRECLSMQEWAERLPGHIKARLSSLIEINPLLDDMLWSEANDGNCHVIAPASGLALHYALPEGRHSAIPLFSTKRCRGKFSMGIKGRTRESAWAFPNSSILLIPTRRVML